MDTIICISCAGSGDITITTQNGDYEQRSCSSCGGSGQQRIPDPYEDVPIFGAEQLIKLREQKAAFQRKALSEAIRATEAILRKTNK